MKKELLIKFIEGKASHQEQKEVLEWAERDAANKRYLILLKNLSVMTSLPEDEAHKEEFNSFKETRLNRNNRTIFRWRPVYGRVSAALFLLALVLNFYQFFNTPSTPQDSFVRSDSLLQKARVINKLSFYTNKGVKGIVTLPDSSVVWLNSDTRITYPERFNGEFREVEISGEAYFEVRSNPDTAMIVTTNKGLKIQVLGTKFLIRSYEDDDEEQATLFSGSIKLISSNKRSRREIVRELKPLESVIVDKQNSMRLIRNADTLRTAAWRNGMLIFEETPINEVLKMLERWHGTEFIITDKSILSCKITAQFKSESIVQIMEIIKFCSPIDYKIIERQIFLSGR
jgi:transmembrane sensor